MSITVNMGGVEAKRGGSLLPPGPYIVAIREANEVTSQKGTEGIEVKMEVVSGPEVGGTVFDRLWITDKALPMVKWRLEAAGVKIPSGSFNLSPGMLVGKRVKVLVGHEDYEDKNGDTKTAARVRSWDPIDLDSGDDMPRAADNGYPMGSDADSDIPF